MSRVKGGASSHARHRKSLKLPKVILAAGKMYLKQPHRLLIKRTNTQPATGKTANGTSAHCGSKGSTLVFAHTMKR